MHNSGAGVSRVSFAPDGIKLRAGYQWDKSVSEKCGIVKISELALKSRRLETFKETPTDIPLKKKDLADAGFYAVSIPGNRHETPKTTQSYHHTDSTSSAPVWMMDIHFRPGGLRKTKPAAACCFNCGLGPTSWPENCNAWVEHARLSPDCSFLRLKRGQAFVDAVQDLNKEFQKISIEMVEQRMGRSAFGTVPNGSDLHLSSQTVCRLCHSKEVAVFFLPCGHLISCTDCAFDRETCRICKTIIDHVGPASLPLTSAPPTFTPRNLGFTLE